MRNKKSKDFFLTHMNNLEAVKLYYETFEEDKFPEPIFFAG